ncbi:MAG: acyltransferase [Myxococcota bacterium]
MAVRHRSHGGGQFTPSELAQCGQDCVFEFGSMVFHPENVHIGRNVYVGHYAILKGYYNSRLEIGDETWIGQQVFLHSAGGLSIGPKVGIGPGVKIITSVHEDSGVDVPILDSPLRFAKVLLEEGCDIGVGTVILPGVTVGRGAQIGAGSVVTRDVPEYTIAAGSPARVVRDRAKNRSSQAQTKIQ